ncbi:secretory pathway Sec39 [Trichoderma citrinoviride]|uniref:Secretory pathway Sec39 n=1 Tax=Trichoderma citrinoviride TaxID=58853 RepID=A0A2T4B2L9_9HYPO|nr:secretory pathway Sec39 [Trichoderma citrinoviride]PTB63573.1 secretory pathway Sec39 [Trichoderma citrinoviride]
MSSLLSPGKVLLLAAHYATHGDIESLACLASRQAKVLHKELLLRILLTYLPETVKPPTYAGFLLALARDSLEGDTEGELDTTPVEHLSEDEVIRQARKLHLQQLVSAETPSDFHNDPISNFLILRSYKIDSEAGLLSQIPSLLAPFLSHSPALRLWTTSTVIPYVRRNVEYYADENPVYSLLDFQKLSDPAAVLFLLSRTGSREEDKGFIGRDVRGLVGPWLHGKSRWTSKPASDSQSAADDAESSLLSPGWEQFLEWLVNQAATSWTVAVAVAEQWGGPKDIDLGEMADLEFTEPQHQYLLLGYARAILASAYLISEATVEALSGAYRMVYKMRSMLGYSEIPPTLDVAVSQLPSLSGIDVSSHVGMKTATYMRNDLLLEQNPLTSPTEGAMALLTALILSASICTSLGVPCSVKKAGDLAFIQDQREQKSEIAKLIRSASAQAHGDEDRYWSQVRTKMLWLNTWGVDGDRSTNLEIRGMLGAVPKEFVETEILKALLSGSRYTLAKSIYEDSSEQPLAAEVIQDTVYQAALRAFDNASNPNRSRGGLKKCDEIIHSFPKTLNKTHPATKRVEALLRCTHALSEYRLTLKQGEPFKPVVLRVHSDPISIIDKVLEQNPKAYTRLPEFLEMAANMVRAGITQQARSVKFDSPAEDSSKELVRAEKLIIALCIEAALREDDFETAYSYVVSRLEAPASGGGGSQEQDEWSWKAALKAGQYVRTDRTLLPTHLGIASGNPEIRHLEQRIECLATALRVAPASQLLEILKTFRRCEEQLDSAIAEEAAAEASWAAAGEVPGAFETAGPAHGLQSSRNMTATAASKQAEEAPMSLFDLSRATASVASRNFTRLSSLSSSLAGAASLASSTTSNSTLGEQQAPQRLRKRDQLREAATGTLVSGVGWLIGANVNREATET